MRTLIVDDEPSMRSLAAKILSRSGATCQMAGSAEEALLRLGREPFDVVVIDIVLPGLSGLELAQRLQQREPDTALVMMTGTTDARSVITAMQAGAADYVVKPFTADTLTRAFDRAAERRRVRLDAVRATGLRQAIVERTLEMRMLLAQPEGTADTIAQSYLTALRLRDPGAAAHAERVAELSRALAAHLGGAADVSEGIARAGLLHDIGKSLLPEAVLARPGGLSAEDLQLVRRHPEYAHDVICGVPPLSDCARAVLEQLEYYDGTGTPLGLRGDQISLPARIIAVANVFDVMTHPRSYGVERTALEALREIESSAGRQFDPEVARALLVYSGVEPLVDDWPNDVEE